MSAKLPEKGSQSGDVEAFLRRVSATPAPATGRSGRRGRLIFAIDATASRQPTWDRAARIQGDMFLATRDIGGLDLQLAFYRGFGEFKASPWLTDSERLARMMSGVACLAGETQLRKVLAHAANQARDGAVDALVFVGDAFEEDVDAVGKAAGELGILGVPVFLFQEGDDPVAGFAFDQVAKLTRGACVRFDPASAETLRDLLRAVAVFAAGGRTALNRLAKREGGAVLRLTHRLDG